MASDVSSGDLHGFLVPDARIEVGHVVARGAGATQSSYTQQADRTGAAEPSQASALVVQTAGDLDESRSLTLRALRGGHPGPGGGTFGWRSTGDASSTTYGWDGPSLLTGVEALLYTTTTSYLTFRPAVLRCADGRVLAAYSQISGTSTLLIKRCDPSTGNWTGCNLTLTGQTYDLESVAFVLLPSGRVLCLVDARSETQVDLYYSDDEGDTWTLGAQSVLATDMGASITGMAAAHDSGTILLLLTSSPGGNLQMAQYASDSLGTRFDLVEADWRTATSEDPEQPAIVVPEGGGFAIVYHDDDGGAPDYNCRRIGSAWEDASTTTAVQIATGGGGAFTAGCAAWLDEDGTVYACLANPNGGEDLTVRRSRDGGATWATVADSAFTSGLETSGYLHTYSATVTGGRTLVVTRWTATTATHDPYSVLALWLGGWSQHTGPAASNSTGWDDPDWCSFTGQDSGGETFPGDVYIAIEEPQNLSWTATGAGTESLTSGTLEIACINNARHFERTHATGVSIDAPDALFAELAVETDSGDGSLAADRIGAMLRVSDSDGAAATYVREVTIRIDATGYAVYDTTAGTQIGSDVAFSFSSTRGRIRVALDKNGKVRTWHSRGGQARAWTAGVDGTTSSGVADPTKTMRVRWGQIGNAPALSTDTSRWEMVGVTWAAGRWTGASTGFIGAAWTSPTDLRGRAWPTKAAAVHHGARVAAVDGPCLIGEEWVVPGDATHPMRSVLPSVDPSPRVRWRSAADEADEIIVLDLGDSSGGRFLGTSLGMALLGSNVRTAYLDYYDGAAWQTVLTIDAAKGFDSLPYKRDGDTVYVDSGTACSSPWLPFGAAVGGTFQLDATTFRKITAHSEGAWEDASTKRPWVRIELSGGEPTSGTGKIIFREALAIRHEQSVDARYWRIKIPSQVTAAGYYEIGQIVIGHLVVLGHPYARGWSVEVSDNSERLDWRAAMGRTRKPAPASRIVEMAWTDPVDGTVLQTVPAAPDYVSGSSSGLPIAARRDGPRLAQRLVATLQGDPVAWVPRIPRATGNQQFAGPDALVWGRLAERMSRDNVHGDEGVSEVDRTGRLVLTELV